MLNALALFTVFFLTYAAKALHTHDPGTLVNSSKSIHQVGETAHCSVCDYHLTKDADVFIGSITVDCRPYYVVHFISYQSITISSTGLNYSDRGPPRT